MSGPQRDTIKGLLPGLHYLAAEALRSGCPTVSQAIFDAISQIELLMLEEGGNDDQRDLCAARATGAEHAH